MLAVKIYEESKGGSVNSVFDNITRIMKNSLSPITFVRVISLSVCLSHCLFDIMPICAFTHAGTKNSFYASYRYVLRLLIRLTRIG